eukprot:TRINITY_DN11227_c0_g1_i1.p2 TRINITY_DN11227_c0_g1~~TRINITY_DN11227_c0_g1_i1.p2  ORF type:complete len:229 (+),score=37.37 TRINITY_DN11227_c0_g1_i1:75-761(+)
MSVVGGAESGIVGLDDILGKGQEETRRRHRRRQRRGSDAENGSQVSVACSSTADSRTRVTTVSQVKAKPRPAEAPAAADEAAGDTPLTASSLALLNLRQRGADQGAAQQDPPVSMAKQDAATMPHLQQSPAGGRQPPADESHSSVPSTAPADRRRTLPEIRRERAINRVYARRFRLPTGPPETQWDTQAKYSRCMRMMFRNADSSKYYVDHRGDTLYSNGVRGIQYRI